MPDTATITDTRTGSHLIAAALAQEFARDDAVVAFGEDIGQLGGVFGSTRRLARRFGSDRVFDTPVSETAFIGMAVGAAQAGLRPVVELMFADFIGVCFDQVLNQMAKNHYMSGGEVRLPLVLRTAAGCIGSAAQHSQILSATFAHIPGLKVMFPGSPGDLQRLMVTAIRDDDPVVFLEHKWLLKSRIVELPYNDALAASDVIEPAPFGKLRRLTEGSDITIITAGWMVQQALLAANHLSNTGISAGVVDLRSLVPLDRDGLCREAARASNVLIVDEDYLDYGMAAEVIATISEELTSSAPRMRRHGTTVSVPASIALEREVIPSAGTIADACRKMLR